MSESLPPDPGQPGPLTHQALQLRNSLRCAAHPVENTLRYFRALLGDPGEACDRGLDFQSAESLHRAGAQGLPLPEIPQLPHSVVQLSRLRASDLAGEKHLRLWAEKHDASLPGAAFDTPWQAQGRLGGAEHHVHHDEATGRWFAATGVLVHDLHDENVVRMARTHELAIIDPDISLARRGTWAALKLAEVGISFPADDPLPSFTA